MNDVFKFIQKLYSLRTTSHFRLRRIRTTKYGMEIPSYLDSKLWNLIPNEYKTIESLADFKAKMRTWVPGNSVSLALVGHLSSNGIPIKIPYGVDVLLH